MNSLESTAIFQAVLRGDLTALKVALAECGDIRNLGRDRDGRTPLFQATINGDTALARELIRHGEDINAQDKNLETPLHFAARDYKLEIAEMLLDSGAQVDAQDIHGNTPLARAIFASQGRGEMILLLLKNKANKRLRNKHGISPEELAQSIGNYDVLRFLE